MEPQQPKKILKFDIRKLKPFQRKGTQLPGTSPDEEGRISDLDPDIQPEEHSYVNHYLSYADRLLNQDDEREEDKSNEPPSEGTGARGQGTGHRQQATGKEKQQIGS